MTQQATPGRITVMVGGGATVIGSFLPFYTAPFGGDVSAWSKGLFPVATYIALFGLLLGAHAALVSFASTSLPDRPFGFTWVQVHLVLGFFALLLAVGYLGTERGGLGLGIGFWLMLLGAVALFVGAIIESGETPSRY